MKENTVGSYYTFFYNTLKTHNLSKNNTWNKNLWACLDGNFRNHFKKVSVCKILRRIFEVIFSDVLKTLKHIARKSQVKRLKNRKEITFYNANVRT